MYAKHWNIDSNTPRKGFETQAQNNELTWVRSVYLAVSEVGIFVLEPGSGQLLQHDSIVRVLSKGYRTYLNMFYYITGDPPIPQQDSDPSVDLGPEELPSDAKINIFQITQVGKGANICDLVNIYKTGPVYKDKMRQMHPSMELIAKHGGTGTRFSSVAVTTKSKR